MSRTSYDGCPDCGGPKARTAERCRPCWSAAKKARARVPCANGCGRPLHAHGLCKVCSRRVYYKKCLDCDTQVGPKSKRCIPCSYEFKRNKGLIDRESTVDAELRRERMSDPAYAAKIDRYRRQLAGYISELCSRV